MDTPSRIQKRLLRGKRRTKKKSKNAEKRRNFTRFARSTCVQNYWIAYTRFFFIIFDALSVGETCGTFHRVYIWITSVMRNVGSTWIDAGGRAFRTYRQVCRSRRHPVSGAGLRRRHAERRQAEPTQVSRCRGVSILGPISAWHISDPIHQKWQFKSLSMANAPKQFLIRIDVRDGPDPPLLCSHTL